MSGVCTASSPLIDAGHNWAIAGITDTDLDGNPRFADDPRRRATPFSWKVDLKNRIGWNVKSLIAFISAAVSLEPEALRE